MENEANLTLDEQINQFENDIGKFLKNSAQKQQPKHEIYVPLWNTRAISITPQRKKQKLSISAFRLSYIQSISGSTSTALYIKYKNGDQFAGITHYLECNFNKHIEKIKKLCTHSLNKQNPNKQITHINFFIIQPYQDITDDNSAYYPNNLQHPLEYFPKKLLEPIQPFTTTLFYYDPLIFEKNSLSLNPENLYTTSQKNSYPIFKVILYAHKAYIVIDRKKIKLPIKNAKPTVK